MTEYRLCQALHCLEFKFQVKVKQVKRSLEPPTTQLFKLIFLKDVTVIHGFANLHKRRPTFGSDF